jgi:hypothetical protein
MKGYKFSGKEKRETGSNHLVTIELYRKDIDILDVFSFIQLEKEITTLKHTIF